MIKLILAGLLGLASSGKYYYRESQFEDKALFHTLQEAQNFVKEGEEALKERTEPWLESVFRKQTIPFIETIETSGPNYKSYKMEMPVGKECSEEIIARAEPQFIECLQRLYAQGAGYMAATEKALNHYLEKRSEYTKKLISEHHMNKENIFECYYIHTMGEGNVLSSPLDNGKTFSAMGLGFCPTLKTSSISKKHGYLATLMTRLIQEARTNEELTSCAEKLAKEDFNTQSAIILHEIGHINNGDERYKRTIKRILPTLTALLGATTLALSQKNLHPLLSTALCASNIIAAALTVPLPALQRRGYSCPAVWLNDFIGEYRADSYALKHATSTELKSIKHFFEKFLEESGGKIDLLDVHPSTQSRIKRIEKQIKKLEDSQK